MNSHYLFRKEIIFNLCLFLDYKQIINFSKVNKFINQVNNDDLLWKIKCQEIIGEELELFKKIYLEETPKKLVIRYHFLNKFRIKYVKIIKKK